MSTTTYDLKERIARLKDELEAVSAALDRLNADRASDTNSGPCEAATRLAAIGLKDAHEYAPLGDEVLSRMGVTKTTPELTGEEVQRLMIREGADPHSIAASRAIIEARGE